MVIIDTFADASRVQLLPNRSISWQRMCWVVIALGIVSFAIAIFWALQGAWIIFPFAGLEIGLLAYLSLKVSSDSYNKQVINIDSSQIHVEWGYVYPKKHWFFERDQSRFVIYRPQHSLSACVVKLIDNEKRTVRLGERLNKDDVDELIAWIRDSNISYQITGRTQINALNERDILG
jgi:uncharacterized membrane protein